MFHSVQGDVYVKAQEKVHLSKSIDVIKIDITANYKIS